MAESRVQIANITMTELGQDLLSTLDDPPADMPVNANRINAVWDNCRDSLLRRYDWNFATYRKQLQVDANKEPLYEYEYGFALPSDYLRLLDIERPPWGFWRFSSDYRIESGTILYNYDTLKIKYIARVSDVSKWDEAFVQLMAATLGQRTAWAITAGRKDIVKKIDDWYNQSILDAVGSNSIEKDQDHLEAEQFIDSRF